MKVRKGDHHDIVVYQIVWLVINPYSTHHTGSTTLECDLRCKLWLGK
jgi:hypothetical protein